MGKYRYKCKNILRNWSMNHIKKIIFLMLVLGTRFLFPKNELIVNTINDVVIIRNIDSSLLKKPVFTFNKQVTIWVSAGSEFRYKNFNYAKYIGKGVGVYSSDLELSNSVNPIFALNLYYQVHSKFLLNTGINLSRIYYGRAYIIGEFGLDGWDRICLTTISSNFSISKPILMKRQLWLPEINCYISFHKSFGSVLLKNYQGVYSRTVFATFKLSYRTSIGKIFLLPFIEFPLFDKYSLKNKELFRTEGAYFWWVLGINIKIF